MELPTQLETKNLIIRPYNVSDWPAFLQFMQGILFSLTQENQENYLAR